MKDKIEGWWEISIAIEHPDGEKVADFVDTIADRICDFFGGHDESDQCPIQWTIGLSPLMGDEEE